MKYKILFTILLGLALLLPIPSSAYYRTYYKLDGNSTDYIVGKNGTDTTVSYVNGRNGIAAYFNGSGYITRPVDTWFVGTNYTFGAWTKTNAAGGGRQTVFYGQKTAGTNLWELSQINATKLDYYLETSIAPIVSFNPNAMNDNKWHQFIVSKDGSGNASLYMDGVLVYKTTSANVNGDIVSGNDQSFIGANVNHLVPFVGAIDMVFNDNTVWSAQQIKTDYQFKTGKLE
jgi:hypothetical protein